MKSSSYLPLSLLALTPLNGAAAENPFTLNPGCQQGNPNIIFILIDDAGYGDIIGQKEIKLPNINKMAKEGMVFTQHYAGAPVSAPSRCALMTGKHTGHTPIRGNKEFYPEGQYPLPLNETTVATLVKKNKSYKTALLGKWGLGAMGSPQWEEGAGNPLRHGFDYFYGYLCQRQAHTYYPRHLWEGKEGKWEKISLNNQYSHSLMTDKALSFIQDNKKNPYFLYLAYTIPHALLQVPQEYVKEFYPDMKGSPLKKNFATMMTLLDRDLGRILNTVDKNNTIIFFASDNGPHKEGGANPKWFNSQGGLRGIKREVYEGGIRVPLLVWGKNVQAGQSTHLSGFWDFLPTTADILGIREVGDVDGISYAPTLFGKAPQKAHPYLYWEFHERDTKQALRQGDWKLIRLKAHTKNSVFELYNLNEDEKEQKNLLHTYPQKAIELMKLMQEARKESQEFNRITPFEIPEAF